MPPRPTARFPGPGGWLPLVVFGALYGAVLCAVAALRAAESPADGTSDFRDFWRTAAHFRHTGQISSELGVHNYLPFFVIFMSPFSYLPLRAASAAFTLLSLGLFALTVVLAAALLGNGPRRGPSRATLVALALALPYVHSCAVLGQLGLLLLFLVIATWFLVERGREWLAGVPLGLAALIKLLPLALLAFFLLKRRWRVAASGLGILLLLGLGLPLASLGYRPALAEHARFYRRVVVGHSAAATLKLPKPHKARYTNNALPIVLRRLLSRVDADPGPRRTALYVNLLRLPRGAIWVIYLLLMTALTLFSLAAALRASRPWPPTTPAGAERVRAQFGLWCCLMLLAAPLVWTHYLVLCYWPLALLAEQALQAAPRRRASARAALLAWLAGALLLAWPAARAAGAQLASVATLWLVLTCAALADEPPTPDPCKRA